MEKTIAQICKGMAEIYAEILNEIGIEAKAIGVENFFWQIKERCQQKY